MGIDILTNRAFEMITAGLVCVEQLAAGVFHVSEPHPFFHSCFSGQVFITFSPVVESSY